jgi:hypothetical protein
MVLLSVSKGSTAVPGVMGMSLWDKDEGLDRAATGYGGKPMIRSS